MQFAAVCCHTSSLGASGYITFNASQYVTTLLHIIRLDSLAATAHTERHQVLLASPQICRDQIWIADPVHEAAEFKRCVRFFLNVSCSSLLRSAILTET